MFEVPLSQVLNVSFIYKELTDKEKKLKVFDRNLICPYCKSKDTSIIVDPVYINKYKHIFINCSYWKSIECPNCSSIFFIMKFKNV